MKPNSYLENAEKARAASQFKAAQTLYFRLLKQKRVDPEEKIEAYLGLADVERIQGLFPQSLEHYQRAARLFKGHHGKTCWDAQVGWALAARASGRPQEALGILLEALAVYQKEKDPEGQAFAHWALGGTYRIAGDMKKGLKELLIALKMFKAQKDEDGIAYTCCALGGIYRMLGRYADSGKYYREANRRMRQNGDVFGIAYSYCGLGNVERMGGRFKRALPFYRKAEKLYGTIGDRVSYAYTLWSIGTTYKMLGQHPKAWGAFEKADQLFKETGDTRGRLYTYMGFFEIHALRPLDYHQKFNSLDCHAEVENIANSRLFPWESGHYQYLINICLKLSIDSLLKISSKKSRQINPELLKDKTVMDKGLKSWKSWYKKTGSKFYPSLIPINWP